jgi:SAM-dependent methyltransferase
VPCARPCPICPSRAAGRRIGTLRNTIDASLSSAAFDLTYCGCGDLVYLDPAPSSADLKAMYETSVQFGDDLYTSPERVDAVLAYMRSCYERLRAEAVAVAPARILEVGAGYSWMCRAAKEADPMNVTIAQDVSAEVAARCRWVDTYVVGDLEHPDVTGNAPYDIISMTHVIEHLVDPAQVLSRCASLLADRGVLFVTAPHRPPGWAPGDIDLEAWKRYSYTHVPAHIQYFSRGSAKRLAERAGLRLSYWSDAHEGGQAFEAWLQKDAERTVRREGPLQDWRARAKRWISRINSRKEST